jgi:hypothetical protein
LNETKMITPLLAASLLKTAIKSGMAKTATEPLTPSAAAYKFLTPEQIKEWKSMGKPPWNYGDNHWSKIALGPHRLTKDEALAIPIPENGNNLVPFANPAELERL